MRRITLLLASCAAIVLVLAGPACQKTQLATSPQKAVKAENKTFNVYYFHRDIRCPSCEKIEALAKQAVEQTFSDDLASGRMTWSAINIDEPQNKHFEGDYRLEVQSVVVSEVQGGKQTRWKNLDKVWDLLDNEQNFVTYVQSEIRAFKEQQ